MVAAGHAMPAVSKNVPKPSRDAHTEGYLSPLPSQAKPNRHAKGEKEENENGRIVESHNVTAWRMARLRHAASSSSIAGMTVSMGVYYVKSTAVHIPCVAYAQRACWSCPGSG